MTDNLPRLISFVGAIGAGKSTAAKYLVEWHGYRRISFADPLKAMLQAFGLNEAQLYGNEKEIPCEELEGRTPRHAMQKLGSEWARDCIGKDLWVNAWRRGVRDSLCFNGRVVVDDCRFENEALAITEFGGTQIRVARDRIGFLPPIHTAGHISESYWVDHDTEILNEDSVEEFYADINEALRDHALYA